MSDELWRVTLDPPAGGLARLIESVQAQREARRRSFVPMSVGAVCALLLAIGVIRLDDRRTGPQRRIENAIRSALATDAQVRVENGAALELPSSRPDVRIFLIASLPENPGAMARP